MKKNIYFVQTGCVSNGEHFLPYASGVLSSYAFTNTAINENYQIADFIYKCDNFDKTVRMIRNPAIVAFSNYMWNYKFNLKLAKKIKELFPECYIIFGGHQISDTEEWLKKYEYIDFAIYGEGEIIFSQILEELVNDRVFARIPNIAYRENGKIFKTARECVCVDVNKIPSPYLTGLFDDIIKNSGDKFAIVMESSRGCPYRCAYCDWGDYNLPVRQFSLDRVKAEIKWIAENKIAFGGPADSNFGMFDSDEEIIDAFIEAKKTYGYPKAVEMAFAKFSNSRIFEMNKKLYENRMSRGATLSMQTLCPEALKNIGRENMTKEKFAELMKLYSSHNIPAYTELILGLPGETYESFCEGIDYLLCNGQHNSIHVFCCEVLPNALMGQKEYIEKHGIQTLKRDFIMRNGENSEGISGSSEIVVGTNDMSREDFVKSLLFSFLVQVFHNFGLIRIPAIYFHCEKGLTYYDFYNKLLDWLNKNPSACTGKTFAEFKARYEGFVVGKDTDVYENPVYGNTQFNLPDGAFLELIKKCDVVYNDMIHFIKESFGEEIDDSILQEMIAFQKAIIRKPDNIDIALKLKYNWVDYYFDVMKTGVAELKKEFVDLKIYKSTEYNDERSYAESILLKGRRTGKSLAINDYSYFKATKS